METQNIEKIRQGSESIKGKVYKFNQFSNHETSYLDVSFDTMTLTDFTDILEFYGVYGFKVDYIKENKIYFSKRL